MTQEKLKVVTVVGTRPEIIRLSRVMAKLDEHCEHILVHTGQNYDYELNEIFFRDLGVRQPDYFLNAAGKNAAETIGKVIASCDEVLEKVKPEALLVLGDTNSCLSVIAAKRRKIPIFHMEAGNRCFDQRVPEEINRKIVDHTADINLTYSSIAREYLLREGLPPDRVIKTGSPMYEVLNHYMPRIDASDALEQLGLEEGRFFVVSAHREENIEPDSSFRKLVESLNAISERYGLPVIVSAHPRTQKRIDAAGLRFNPLIKTMKPLGFFDYVSLQRNARAVLSDSGTISEEASILNFPALNLREAHERPEGTEETAVIMTGLSSIRILQGLAVLEKQHLPGERPFRVVADYSVPNVSDKIVRIIYSYTDYVNRIVWRVAD
ncbi:MAG: non-hydrolyzing UDP-N-acetylglucosamine 2-epimerase [Allorhizobium sp.]